MDETANPLMLAYMAIQVLTAIVSEEDAAFDPAEIDFQVNVQAVNTENGDKLELAAKEFNLAEVIALLEKELKWHPA